jgi:hypothetical protein
MITHDDLLVVLAVTIAIVMLGFGWLGYLTYESHRIMMAVDLMVHQEAEKIRARFDTPPLSRLCQ